MAMPPRYYVTAAAQRSRRGGYGALDDRKAMKIVCIRTTAYENVPCNDVGRSTHLSDKEDCSVQAVAFQVAYRPAGVRWLIGRFEKCRICGFVCRGVRFRPNNDPYLKLLQKIGQQDSSIVDLNELANSNQDVRGSINNIKETRLAILLRDKPSCARHFYYNANKQFAIEDPALFYFLKHLDWPKLRQDCGFKATTRDWEYDFALSFAGENRELARQLAEQLSVLDAHVFFDEHFEANFLGGAWSGQF